MRMMPCESVPRRLAQTSILAHSAACSRVRPTATKIDVTKSVSSALRMRRDSWTVYLQTHLNLSGTNLSVVMAGLVPAIPIGCAPCLPKRDARHKAGHDVARGELIVTT